MRIKDSLYIDDSVLWTSRRGRIVVLKKWIAEIMEMAHNNLGHFGRRGTLDIIYQRIYWPRMSKTVQTWNKSCRKCAEYNSPSSNFESKVVKLMYESLVIKRLRTSTYLPKYDGITERANRTIVQMPSKTLETDAE
ncbi:hypothetical protein RF11_10991 [Thelohanellus kitauei]|uniref:Integrase zinc-binding domain-containing protein n=1 Tax=Thelohanellus kitauei TaxID=669202 RepID=A0A0C2I7A0_THEKT|nr:hypothetical protein RF11_10991 [Thelohanellus kitauei]